MIRTLCVIWLCVALLPFGVAAQGTFRPRFGSVPGSDNPNQPPTINITAPVSPCVTGSSTTPYTSIAGNASDDLGLPAMAVSCVNAAGGACTVDGTFTWTSSVVLSAGSNAITFTVTDGSQTAQTSCTVTYTAPPDPTPPVVTITAPTSAGTYETTASTVTLQGTCTDNVACVTVTYAIDGGSQVACTGTLSPSWSCNNIALTVATHTIVVTGSDANGNTHTDSIDVTRNASSGAVSISITTPTSGSSTTTNDLDITGTASAENGIDEIRCTTDSYTDNADYGENAFRNVNGSSVPVASGGPFPVGPYAFSSPNNRLLKLGTNTYKCWVFDTLGNSASSSGTVITYNKSAAIITTKVPPVQIGVAMTPWDLYPDGGSGTYVWDNGSGGSSIGCGLIITDTTVGSIVVGRISGTPTTLGACTANVRVTAGTSATRSLTINGQTGAIPSATAHWDVMNARAEKFFASRFHTQADINTYTGNGNISNPYILANGTEAVIDWPVIAATQSSDSLPSAYQIRVPIGITSGSVLVQFDIKYEYSWLPYSCRPGGLNSNFVKGYNHKEYNLFGATADSPTNGVIYFETDFNFNTELNDCTFIGTFKSRLNGNQPGSPAGYTAAPNVSPTGMGALAADSYVVLPNAWTTVTKWIRLNVANTDFDTWEASTGATLATGTYNMESQWAQNEYETTASTLLFEVPHSRTKGTNPTIYSAAGEMVLEFNTSNPAGASLSDITPRLQFRNFSILRDYTFSDPANPTNDTTIFQPPTR